MHKGASAYLQDTAPTSHELVDWATRWKHQSFYKHPHRAFPFAATPQRLSKLVVRVRCGDISFPCTIMDVTVARQYFGIFQLPS